MSRPGGIRQRVLSIVKLLVAAVVLVWLVASGRLDLAKLLDVQDRWWWFVVAQLCFGAAQIVAALRWRLLLASQGLQWRLGEAFRLTLLGIFFNQVLLGTTGGDIARGYVAASQRPGHGSAVVVSVIADRAIGLSMLLVVALVAGGLNWRLVSSRPEVASFLAAIAAVLALAAGSTVALFSGKLRGLPVILAIKRRLPFSNVLSHIDAALWTYRARPADLVRAALLSVVLHGLIVATNLCLALALVGEPFDRFAFLVLVPIALAAMAVPLNPPGALGVGEALYQHLLGLAGFPAGSLVCVLQRLTFVLWSVPGAAAYVLSGAGPARVDRRAGAQVARKPRFRR